MFADPEQGLNAAAKLALATAFRRLGVDVRSTDKAGSPMVGEKDLRLAGAQDSVLAQPLFNAWIDTARSKKRAQMALDWAAFAGRSEDARIHSLLGHGPATGRLSSAEPNSQQAPRDQGFRSMIAAGPGNSILAVDYSALDMRVGAALAVRAQMEIQAAYAGSRETPVKVLAAIQYAVDTPFKVASAALEKRLTAKNKELADLQATSKGPGQNDKKYWTQMRELKSYLTLLRFSARLVEVRQKAKDGGNTTYSALRDALQLGVDIHTFTAMGMAGHEPLKEFKGLSGDALEQKQKHWKKVLGDKRQNGKISNLSLLYAMQALGLQTAAGKVYNVHWGLEESAAIIVSWLNSYPEIDLWHLWTELNPIKTIWAPDPDCGGKRLPRVVYLSTTLGGRKIYTFGLNAALAYGDQGSGADILGDVMHKLRVDYPDIFAMAINQVHDELVLEIPDTHSDEVTKIVHKVMDACANVYLSPYEVPSACTPALGKVWLKD
jgi:hypothetical protein